MSNPDNNVGLADIGLDTDSEISMSPTTNQSWRQLLEISSNKTRKIRGSNYVQLATVDAQGAPRCRTVVFRGFLSHVPVDHAVLGGGHQECSNLPSVMKMITDARSNKVSDVAAHQGQAELVWWFPKTSEQYRISGKLILVGPNNTNDAFLQTMRRETWGNLSDAAREAFYDERVPGQPYNNDNESSSLQNIPPGGRDAETGKVLQPPPAHFLLMLLVPHACDYLRLGQPEQYRQVDVRHDDGTWTLQRVNP